MKFLQSSQTKTAKSYIRNSINSLSFIPQRRNISTSRSRSCWDCHPRKILPRWTFQWHCIIDIGHTSWYDRKCRYSVYAAARFHFRFQSMLCVRLGQRSMGKGGKISSYSEENRFANYSTDNVRGKVAIDSSRTVFQFAREFYLCWWRTWKRYVQRRWWFAIGVSNTWETRAILSGRHCGMGHRMRWRQSRLMPAILYNRLKLIANQLH